MEPVPGSLDPRTSGKAPMARDISDETPIESRDALIAYLEAGSKPKDNFRIGTEHEKFPFQIGRAHV